MLTWDVVLNVSPAMILIIVAFPMLGSLYTTCTTLDHDVGLMSTPSSCLGQYGHSWSHNYSTVTVVVTVSVIISVTVAGSGPCA